MLEKRRCMLSCGQVNDAGLAALRVFVKCIASSCSMREFNVYFSGFVGGNLFNLNLKCS
jgi:hypothetical protein